MDYNVTAENQFYRLFKTFDEVNKKDTDSVIFNNLFAALFVIACDTIRTSGEGDKKLRIETARFQFKQVYQGILVVRR